MKWLSVVGDRDCTICRRCSEWLMRQPAYLPLRFIALQSPQRRHLFPALDSLHPEEQLLVISDEGAVDRGASAWVMCLCASLEYREHALRVANPVLWSLASIVCEVLSAMRYRISRWLLWQHQQDVARQIEMVAECHGGKYAVCSRTAA